RKEENKHAHDLWVADVELWKGKKREGNCTHQKPLWTSFKLSAIPKPAVLQRKSKKTTSSDDKDGRDEEFEEDCPSDVSGSSGDSDSD
ncbi:hypothetical protein V5O48_019242, partial [Marasmius crinis-equi]